MIDVTAPDTSVNAALPAALGRLVEQRPGAIALREKHLGVWRQYSRRDYLDHARAIALGLRALGVQAGDRVAVVSGNRAEWFFADIAIQGLGAQTVGVDPGASAEVVRERLLTSGTTTVIVEDQEQYDKVIEVRPALAALTTIVVIDDRGVKADDPAVLTLDALRQRGQGQDAGGWPGPLDDGVATALEVGGGGHPIIVRAMSHSQLAELAVALEQVVGPMRASDEILCHLPLSHATERTLSMVGALRAGYAVDIATEPALFIGELGEVQPTVMVTTPAVWAFVATTVRDRVANSSRLKRRIGQGCLDRGGGSGWATVIWRRPARRQLGLTRLRAAVSTGALESEAAAVFAALGLAITVSDDLTGVSQ